MAPLLPASPQARALGARRGALVPLVLGRPVPPPTPADAAPLCGELPAAECAAVLAGLRPESAAVLRDVVRGRFRPAAIPGVGTLVVSGERDPLLPPVSATLLARTVGAEHEAIQAGGHWLLGGSCWQRAADVVHRWTVRRLGEPLLEYYAEAMSDREANEEPEE
jgi:pimeloyl-ACP methyl ester carboxylesterase